MCGSREVQPRHGTQRLATPLRVRGKDERHRKGKLNKKKPNTRAKGQVLDQKRMECGDTKHRLFWKNEIRTERIRKGYHHLKEMAKLGIRKRLSLIHNPSTPIETNT